MTDATDYDDEHQGPRSTMDPRPAWRAPTPAAGQGPAQTAADAAGAAGADGAPDQGADAVIEQDPPASWISPVSRHASEDEPEPAPYGQPAPYGDPVIPADEMYAGENPGENPGPGSYAAPQPYEGQPYGATQSYDGQLYAAPHAADGQPYDGQAYGRPDPQPYPQYGEPAAYGAAPQRYPAAAPAPAPPAARGTRQGRHYVSDQSASPQPAAAPPAPGYAAPSSQPPAGPPQTAPMPRPEDLLVPNQSPVTTEPASWGWRGKVNRASGGLIKAKAAPHELVARRAITDIQRGFSRPMTVVVIQPKGGAGKTPTTICLSAAFGAHRGGYVVGWDDNETRGTLAVRVSNPDDQRATAWDLLSDLSAFERFDARVGDLSYYVRPQPDAHFDALVSDDNPGNMAQIGEDEFNRLHRVLQRFYRMIVVDTGNNVRSPNWQAAVNAADLVVVVSTYQRDAGYSGSWVLDHLAQTGREELARNAVTVLSAADPTTDRSVREQLLAHFGARTGAVAEIPYDPQLAHGGPIRWTDLAARTRNSWVEAGALIVNSLAEVDQRELAARRG